MRLHEIVEQIGSNEAIDEVAKPAAAKIKELIPAGPVKDTLSGTPIGHPLHPILTDVAIGAFASAVFLDWTGGKRRQPAVKSLLGVGILASLPTAASGAADWSETIGEERRIGAVHAAANAIALGLFTASLLSRRGGRRAKGRLLGLAGISTLAVSGYLGGHLSFARGVGVNNAFREKGPGEWTPILDGSSLEEGKAQRVEVDGAPVVLYRTGGRVYALGATCTHAGGPLDEGSFDDTGLCVQCPWHGSVFSLEDGSVVHGPASIPEPAYEVEVGGDGKISIRRQRA